ncbi:MAG TPA: RDD family protein [Frankiaceae bacterium]|nr:RDD family protein [Frankiaceae bacterium]
MARETRQAAGSWLEGPAFQRTEPRGGRLGLPADGPGSLATPGARVAAFVIDGVVANLLAGVPYLFGVSYGPGERGYVVLAAFLLQEFLLVSATGASIGKQLCGIRVVRADGGRLPWPWVLVRTVLLGFLVPAVIWDRDGRGLHDRAAGALTLRVGKAPVGASAARGTTTSAAEPGQPGDKSHLDVKPGQRTDKPGQRTDKPGQRSAAKRPPQRRKRRR